MRATLPLNSSCDVMLDLFSLPLSKYQQNLATALAVNDQCRSNDCAYWGVAANKVPLLPRMKTGSWSEAKLKLHLDISLGYSPSITYNQHRISRYNRCQMTDYGNLKWHLVGVERVRVREPIVPRN